MSTENVVRKIVDAVRNSTNPKQSLSNLKRNQDIVPAIVAIIKGAVNQTTAAQVVTHAPTDDIVDAITRAIRNSVKLPAPVAGAAVAPVIAKAPSSVAVPVIQQAPASEVARAVTNAARNGVALSPEVLQAAEQKKPGLFQRLLGFFAPKNKMPTYGPETRPNFIEPKITGKNNQGRNTYNQTPPAPGYVLTTRNGKLGWYKNNTPSAPTSGPAPPPPQSRNYSKMTVRELLKAMKDYPANREAISQALRKAFDKELRDLRYEYSRSRRVRKLGDLLRLLPRNYDGRRNASSMVVNDVRETRNSRELSNVRSNLGSVPNENIRRAIENQRRRFEEKKRREENERRRTTTPGSRRRNVERYTPSRRYGEGNTNYYRRVKSTDNQRELVELMRRRRAARVGEGGNGGVGGENRGGPPPLPMNQQRAINNAGGANTAMNTVAQVPGGAPEIAKAAEALNESGGNSTIAIRVKGASPAAVNAVQKLGGPNNTVHVLEGLNTMSQTYATRKRKGTRRPKKVLRPRVAELNRVISAVKKQRLISLVAHNVTKTHNIHPNDEKLKKYYKKVLKANILRTPFAKIAKSAEKKRVLSSLKA